MTPFTHLSMIANSWYEQQAKERDRMQREAVPHRVQHKVYAEACFDLFWELGFLRASGPRAAVSGLKLLALLV